VIKERELRSELGTLFLHMEGTLREDGSGTDFTWRITGATGEYEGLTGNGDGTDLFVGSTRLTGEFSGRVEN
jgi:hypothetical protein